MRTDWQTRDLWLRRSFELLAGPALAIQLADREFALRIHHDEDAEIYLNGVEIARLSRWTSGYVEIPLAADAVSALRTGRNVLAIHCRQNNGGQYLDAGIVEYVRPADRKLAPGRVN